MSKIHFESNSQHCPNTIHFTCYWKRHVKDTFWKQFTTLSCIIYFILLLKATCQRYILKAIHNYINRYNYDQSIESDMSKIHFESNSQPRLVCLIPKRYWKRHVKDTFWKQFTTQVLWFSFEIYWKRHVKDTFWKQFTTIICIPRHRHNWKRHVKDTFWKQFTTRVNDKSHNQLLKATCQRYILKAIHNPIMM